MIEVGDSVGKGGLVKVGLKCERGRRFCQKRGNGKVGLKCEIGRGFCREKG